RRRFSASRRGRRPRSRNFLPWPQEDEQVPARWREMPCRWRAPPPPRPRGVVLTLSLAPAGGGPPGRVLLGGGFPFSAPTLFPRLGAAAHATATPAHRGR